MRGEDGGGLESWSTHTHHVVRGTEECDGALVG